ncbi:MAG: ATP-dependent DNA helicase RecG [Candidatus Neomarinimicrobiota bacterium]
MDNFSLSLSASIENLKGVGPARLKAFQSLGISSIADLLYNFPRRHLDRTTITPINKLRKDSIVTVVGTVEACGIRRTRRSKIFHAKISDGSGVMTLTWFNGLAYIQKAIKTGDKLAVSGKVEFYRGFQITHPEYDQLKKDEDSVFSGAIIPLYAQNKDLKQARLDTRAMRRLIKEINGRLPLIKDHFSQDVISSNNLVSLNSALRNIHFPESKTDLSGSIRRLKFDEHFFLQLLMALKKHGIKRTGARPLKRTGIQLKLIRDNLNFELTAAQKKVFKEIRRDMARPQTMNRLLQGDVGSGKTIVAVMASSIAAANQAQTAVMAPTEILAHQHFLSFKNRLEKARISCGILVGGTPEKERKLILKALKQGSLNVIIGTHALIQKDVAFKSLGLVIVDEQHRFGVVQRSDLLEKGFNPHFLAMTATPIPRTLAITYYGDMDLSVINEMPALRLPVITKIVKPERLSNVYQFISKEVSRGFQSMIVYPLVEETEKSDLAAAVEAYEELKIIFKNIKIGLIHGRLKKREKDKIMDEFSANQIKVLISTTVIEVGIDIPTATVMLVEHAERFGLTQLHQLRGRVGRAGEKSYCILVQRKITDNSNKRLKIMESTNDGFMISDEDLKMRGPGEFFGIRQSGFLRYKIADLALDGPIIRKARTAAFQLVEQDPKLKKLENKGIRRRFINEYQDLLKDLLLS